MHCRYEGLNVTARQVCWLRNTSIRHGRSLLAGTTSDGQRVILGGM